MKKLTLLALLLLIVTNKLIAQTILGIDVSHNQGTINWQQVKANGVTFAWSKATDGLGTTDNMFSTNMSNGNSAAIIMGAYHFARPYEHTAVDEANYFLSVASPYIKAGYLPPVLDIEDPSDQPTIFLSNFFTNATLTAWVQAWVTAVKNATGVTPIIYTNSNYATYLNSSLNSYDLWIAKPDGSATTPPTGLGSWTTWAFKQYSWTGSLSGISTAVDLDVFNGNSTSFNNLIAGSVAQPPVNDNCSSATLLTSSTSINYLTAQSVNNATPSGFPKAINDLYSGTPSLDDVWYYFQAVGTSTTITVNPNGSSLDAIIAAYTSCTNNVEINSSDTPGGDGVLSTLTIPTTPGNLYYIRVYDYGGTNTTNGGFEIAVTHTAPVCTPIVISTNPVSQTVSGSSFASFNCVASAGTSISYQWQYSTNFGSTWNNVPNSSPYSNVNSSALSINPTNSTMNGYEYHCILSNSCSSSTTNLATLTVTPSCTPSLAPTIIDQLTSNTQSGPVTQLTIEDGSLGTNATWNWYTGSCGGTLIASGTSNTITVTPSATTTYYVRAESGCNITDCATVTVDYCTFSVAPTSITPSANNISPGTPITLTVNGGFLGTNASWLLSTGSCGGTVAGSGRGSVFNVSPTVTTTYYLQAVGSCNTTDCISITVIVTSNCTSSSAPTSVVAANAVPTQTGTSVQLIEFGGILGTNASWVWYNGKCGGAPIASTTDNSITVTPTSTTTYYVSAVGSCNTTNCDSVTVIVNPIISSFSPTTATEGMTVTITGLNLENASSVDFGSVPAQSFNQVSSSTITAVVGSGSSGSIFIQTPIGLATGQGFTYGTLTFSPIPSQIYGASDFSPGAVGSNVSYTSSNTSVATIVSGNIHVVGAGTTVITATDGSTTLTQNFVVTPAALIVTANNQTKIYASTNPTLTIAYAGFVNGDTPNNLTVQPTISTTATVTSPIGSYPITVSGATSPNYSITFVAGTLTISPSADASLANIFLSGSISLTPAFAAAITNYSGTVSNSVESIQVTPLATSTYATITVNSTAVTSGTASGVISLNAGSNTITIGVTAQDGVTTEIYTVIVTRALSTDATLVSIGSSVTPLAPVFNSNTTSYTLSVGNTTTSMTVKPVATDRHATIKVNGTALASGTTSTAISLAEGATTAINVVVTAQDGITTKTYTITVTRTPSSVASLSNIQLSSGTLSPLFAAATLSYNSSVPNSVTAMTVTPTSTDVNAVIMVDGAPVASGTASASILLVEGATTAIRVVATAQNGAITKTYTINVTRAPSSIATLTGIGPSISPITPVFNSATTSYTLSVGNTTATMTVTPVVTDLHATIKVNGTTLTSGTTSAAIALAEGTTTAINVVVTAQDGNTTKTYTITVIRAPSSIATLTSMGPQFGPLSPVFAPATTSYTLSVSNATKTMTVKPVGTDANATIKVNGTPLSSGTTSAAIALAEGATTTINVVVTAQNGTNTKTYTIAVTRPPSAIATLSNIQLSKGTLQPGFAAVTTNYTVSVANSVSAITLTPTSTDANAAIKVNGTSVASGTASSAIALTEGAATVINVIVTSQDGTSTKTYSVTITRAPSSDATLSALGPQFGPLTPVFTSAITSYTLNVANGTKTMTIKPVATDANATIKVNGTTISSGTTSAPIALATGSNTISAIVTAQDGTTKKIYIITVTRASGGADSFDPGISVTKPTETTVLEDDGIRVHQGVSPNGDGVNDFLQIDNIGQYPDNRLTIMNRNGKLIFDAKGYNNSSKVFDGHSSKNGLLQLPGTYFYQLDYTVKGIVKQKTGFIVLKY